MSKLVAQQNMKEFDPKCEKHWPLLIVKAVDPGCTLELQIEVVETGEVIRLTTTEFPEQDNFFFEQELLKQFRKAWRREI